MPSYFCCVPSKFCFLRNHSFLILGCVRLTLPEPSVRGLVQVIRLKATVRVTRVPLLVLSIPVPLEVLLWHMDRLCKLLVSFFLVILLISIE